jgi:cytochrome c biogenesis protein CcmG/thiol:disulfide interchange protein DsbE
MTTPAAPPTAPKVSRWALWLPLALFAGFVALVMIGLLRPADRTIESKMVGKPMPGFALPARVADRPGLSRADLIGGKPRLVNVFASWCIHCITEAPVLGQLRLAGVEIVGVAIRDREEDVARFLAQHGNPYSRIGADDVSAVQFALGSSGVPESFIVDARGTIRYQHIGEIRPDQVPMILEKLKEAEQ